MKSITNEFRFPCVVAGVALTTALLASAAPGQSPSAMSFFTPSSASMVPLPAAEELREERSWTPFVRLGAGFGALLDGDLDARTAGGDTALEASYAGGLFTGGSFGFHIDERWSVDVEFAYRGNDLDEVRGGGMTITEGDFASAAITLNARYRFLLDYPVRPYVGAGIGYIEEIDLDLGGSGDSSVGEDDTIAYQFIVGAETEVVQSVNLFAEARYLGVGDFDLDRGTGTTYDGDYQHFGFLFGVEWSF